MNPERRRFLLLAAAAGMPIMARPAAGAEFISGTIRAIDPWTPPSAPGATLADVYMSIENNGSSVDYLVGIQSPAARAANLTRDNPRTGVIETTLYLDVSPRGTLELNARFMHVRLLGLIRPLRQGDRFPLTLVFSDAGAVDIEVDVDRR